MKSLFTITLAVLLTVGWVAEADARRLGGGGGFGKKATPAQQRNAPEQRQRQQDQQQSQQQNQQGQNAAQPGRTGMMGGMLGGLLAGGMFAYLLGSGAFEGIQFMDILLLLVIVGGGIWLFRRLRASQAPAYAGMPDGVQTRQSSAPFSSSASVSSGSAVNTPEGFDASSVSQSANAVDLPDGFDADAFVEGALAHYRTLQQAWNDGDMTVIRDYVSPALCDALEQQRNRLMVPPQTEVVSLSAEIVAAGRQGEVAEISLLFRGLCRDALEKSEDGIYDVWHLERDLTVDGSPWMLVGIEAE